ncbi:MAG: DUF4214 domain-containing protein, partial [Acidimicrobiales bacterium]|nr:DUF4214 domain-containing protein [Acidimicrobiales bacterium]
LVASACLPKAPPPEPPPVAAPPGTWRAEAEAFVQAAMPLLVGTGDGRESAGDGRVRGDQVVRTSPAAVAAAIATTPGGAAHAVDRADERLGTGLDGAARNAVATEVAAGRIDEDEATVRLALAPGSPLAGLGDEAFVDATYPMVVGRAADPGGRSYWLGRLGGGESRSSMVRSLARSGEARRIVVAAVHDELGLAPPSTGERDLYADLLGSTGGSTRALRAQLVTAALAPAPRVVGVMGDSVAFGLSFYLGAVQVGPVQHVRGGTKIGCGVLSARAGWQVQATDGSFHPPADGRCATELPG